MTEIFEVHAGKHEIGMTEDYNTAIKWCEIWDETKAPGAPFASIRTHYYGRS